MQELVLDHARASIVFLTLVTVDTTPASNPASRGTLRSWHYPMKTCGALTKRERLERTVRLEADIRTSGDQRLEVRGVSTEIYRDAKGVAGFAGWTFLYVLFTHWRLCIASVLLVWLLISSIRK
jgi:hypothetical protein